MEPLTITYRIQLGNKKKPIVFDFKLDPESGDLVSEPVANPPAWTALEYRQCEHCPLKKEEHPQCPIALQLFNIIDHFHDTRSIDEVTLEVVTEERTISQQVHLQHAIGSMLGLVAPTCGCPKMAYMKPMARFHLPLSTEEETVYRVAGMFMLAQHVWGRETVDDFSGLKAIYADLHILNKTLATRLRGATQSDSSKNAIALLDMYSNLVPMMIDDRMPNLKQLFSAYETLPELRVEAVVTPEEVKKPVVPREKTAEELELEALMQDVEADELAALLGTGSDIKIKQDGLADKPRGRASFKLADD